jgi:hypothetical protein
MKKSTSLRLVLSSALVALGLWSIPAAQAQGCKATAGYSWNAELANCIRPLMTSAITLEVAAHHQKCPGQVDAKCLMVREVQEGQKKPRWAPFYGEIAGYQHTTSQRQILRVRKDLQENASADAPGFTYQLIKKLR